MLFNNNNQSSFFLEKFTKRIHQIFTRVPNDTLGTNSLNTVKQAESKAGKRNLSEPNFNLDISKDLFDDGLAEASTKSPMFRKSDSKKDSSSNFKRNFSRTP